MEAVLLPILDANMTHGVVRAWLKREGDVVEVGEPLFEVETDKVNAQVEAETSGILRCIVVPVGMRVPVLTVLAFIGSAEEALPPPETWKAPMHAAAATVPEKRPPALGRAAFPSSGDVGEDRIKASPAARRLAREHGLSLDAVRPTGTRSEVTRADVEQALAKQASARGGGEIDPAFLGLLRKDSDRFRALSSEMKVHLYRQHGAEIGERVRIEPGTIVIAEDVVIGAGSTIGADSTLECERLHVGRLVSFGKRTRVHCRSVEVGDALWSKEDVVIGGGGSSETGARLRAGDACFFGEGAYLNTCHPLTLGDEVCIGSRAMLFTHSHWQSVLRGYRSLFGPIQIGDHVFIGNNAFVFPGVSIGPGATVIVNSFVATNVAAETLVGGVPAGVLRHIAAPGRDEQITIMRAQMAELATALGERGFSVTLQEQGDDVTLSLGDGTLVRFSPAWRLEDTAPDWRRAVVLTFEEVVPGRAMAPGLTLFDFQTSRVHGVQDGLSDEVREFCRRRGIRFRPLAWRYGVGHFDGKQFWWR